MGKGIPLEIMPGRVYIKRKEFCLRNGSPVKIRRSRAAVTDAKNRRDPLRKREGFRTRRDRKPEDAAAEESMAVSRLDGYAEKFRTMRGAAHGPFPFARFRAVVLRFIPDMNGAAE